MTPNGYVSTVRR